MNTSDLYKNTGKIALASKLSLMTRTKMYSRFTDVMKPVPSHLVLDVGVTSDDQYLESNYFEKMYPYKDRIVCVGTEDGSFLEQKYPGIRYTKVYSGESLPFKDKEFDVAFSNAVIEHVGDIEDQKAFVREVVRVSKSFFITTPNRWFPIEFHTAIPFLHWLPKPLHRKVLDAFGEKYWSRVENLNILSMSEFKSLFPSDVRIFTSSVSLFGYPTNLIVYGNS